MKKYVFLIIPYVICLQSFAQDLPNITPPSPVAYELGKYGQIPVGMFTGTPNMDIPIYTYKSGNLSVPISLSYNSNGIKVDQISSNVGLGWSLNVGGVITRIVKDRSDEDTDTLYPESEIHDVGLNSPMAMDFFYLAAQPDVDTETDMYMYNFLGYSGSFVFDHDDALVMIPNKDILIEPYAEGSLLGFKATTNDGVEYMFLDSETTENAASGGGTHPTSEFHTTSWYLTRIVHPTGDQINFVYSYMGYSYVMSKTQSLTVATPTYQSGCPNTSGTGPGYTLSPATDVINTLTVSGKRLIEINSNKALSGKVLLTSNTSHPEIGSYKLLSNLTVKNGSNVSVETFDFNYLLTTNKRAFLTGITFKNPNQRYAFEYIDPQGLVGRLSKAQDYWGYYNGKSTNAYWFPNPQSLPFMPNELSTINIGADKSVNPAYAQKGLLSKITYPTKGYSQITYEANNYWGANTTLPNEKYLILNVSTGDGESGSTYQDLGTIPTIPFNQRATFSIYVSFNSQECGEDLLKSKAQVVITDNQTSSTVGILEQQQSGYVSTDNLFEYNDTVNTFYVDLVAGHSYTVKLIPMFFCTNAIFNLEYYDQAPTTQNTNLTAGGLRVSEIKSYPDQSSSPNIVKYYYGKKESISQSSGEPGQLAYYLSNQTNRISCGSCSYVDQHFTSLNSTSQRPLFNSSSNGTTYYKYVTVSYGGNDFETGGEENEFIIHNDYPGNPLLGDPINSSTWVNAGWSNGLLKKKTIFKYNDLKTSFINLKLSINNYIQDNRYFKKVYGYTVNKKYDFICNSPVTYSCTSSDLTKQFEWRYCTANHKHWYLTVNSRNCIASGNNNVSWWIQHPCYGKSVGYVTTKPEEISNLDIMEYTTNSYWSYLNQSIDKQYDQNGLNPIETITNYYYDNPEHLQLTRTETTTSNLGDIISAKTYYPDDVINNGSLLYNNLTAGQLSTIGKLKKGVLHQIATPLQVENKVRDSNGNEISNSVVRTNFYEPFTNLILPRDVQTLKGTFNLSTNNLKNRVQYNDYYPNGNIKEVLKTDGATIVYIWGYNEQYPIAKIENATYSQVSGQVANLQSLSNADVDSASESTLRSALSSLRASVPNAMVTTYTYDPLVGVTSSTDASGYTSYYKYDDYNRLKYLENKDGEVMEQYRYNHSLVALGASMTSSSSSVNVGSPITFTVSVSGGSGQFQYEWTIPGVSNPPNSSQVTVTTTSTHSPSFTATCKVIDTQSLENITVSKGVTVTQSYPALSVGDITYNGGATKSVGNSVTYSIIVSGGSGNYNYKWTKTNSQQTITLSNGTASSVTNTVTTQDCDSYVITCIVTDNVTSEIVTKTKTVYVVFGCD